MADQEQKAPVVNLRKDEGPHYDNQSRTANYLEETSAEMAAPASFGRSYDVDRETDTGAGRGMGFAAIILSILSLFVAPILFGAAGIVLGFIARRRGAQALGSWAIGIGVVSIIIGMFVLPFF
ncbi:DUF4190 domain-containing protein [Robertmurraya andreesenii]|uniref:DUF4190 domain-containing protein n=1 Tax=Anoxybacillus andreesenii TaxID=1325932 RepID=A0ABT9V5Y6_9BACL|nr:DUF4190 domain-containing protein [Robertmurraya andreesenii]MDQ0156366.1 hypothetical protein [Robertmurraya andreesenii]